jgi:hypothetical protein
MQPIRSDEQECAQRGDRAENDPQTFSTPATQRHGAAHSVREPERNGYPDTSTSPGLVECAATRAKGLGPPGRVTSAPRLHLPRCHARRPQRSSHRDERALCARSVRLIRGHVALVELDRRHVSWLQRFIDERLPPLSEVALAASALAAFRHGKRDVGVEALKLLLCR